jgi:hypothetical protein
MSDRNKEILAFAVLLTRTIGSKVSSFRKQPMMRRGRLFFFALPETSGTFIASSSACVPLCFLYIQEYVNQLIYHFLHQPFSSSNRVQSIVRNGCKHCAIIGSIEKCVQALQQSSRYLLAVYISKPSCGLARHWIRKTDCTVYHRASWRTSQAILVAHPYSAVNLHRQPHAMLLTSCLL